VSVSFVSLSISFFRKNGFNEEGTSGSENPRMKDRTVACKFTNYSGSLKGVVIRRFKEICSEKVQNMGLFSCSFRTQYLTAPKYQFALAGRTENKLLLAIDPCKRH